MGEFRALLLPNAKLRTPVEQQPGDDPVLEGNGRYLGARLLGFPRDASFSSSLRKRRMGAAGAAGSPISAAVKLLSGVEFLALVLTAGRVKMRAPVDCDLAGIQSVTPFAQRMRRQLHRSGVGTDAHSAPIHRLHMHRPERLCRAVADVRADGKPLLLPLSQRFCSLFPALLAAQFRLIFREFTCSFFAGKLLQPTPKRVLGETLLTTIFADPETAPAPRFDVQRPPLASRFVLEVFRSHRRISTAAENPKWNDIARRRKVCSNRTVTHDGRTAR